VDIDEIAALLHPFAELTPQQLADTLTYINLLQKWNARINLTAVRNPQEVVTRHFGESFFAARILLPKDLLDKGLLDKDLLAKAVHSQGDKTTVTDLGSGAGFPGLPMAMFAPHANVTLIESNGKKAAFLNEIIRALNLKNATVFSHRAEEYSHPSSLVVMRAVEKFESSLLLAATLVEPGGRLAIMVSHPQVKHATSLVPQCTWQEPISIPGGHSRVLLAGTL
jgi:16S rRNA (guanine527-N7)-methyltransferase